MKQIKLIALISVLLFSFGCKPSREKEIRQIETLYSSLYSQQSAGFNKPKADSLLKGYDQFIKDFPTDTLAPVYLFKSANLAMTVTDGNDAIARFDHFANAYPNHPKAAVSLFFKAFVYENSLKNFDKAKECYLLFIEKYPNHELVKDATMSLANLGKTPEQVIHEFEERQKQDSIRISDSIAKTKGKKTGRKHS
ncbi:MAG: tetratricopeptide repeat protein [Bacteroidota bacterium]